MKPKHVMSWIAMVAALAVVGSACETDDDEGTTDPFDETDDDLEGVCDKTSPEEHDCLDACDAGWEPCYNYCVYVSPSDKASCQDACQSELYSCRIECDEAYEDLTCSEEGPDAADNPSGDDDPDLSGDDDPDEDDDEA